MPGGSTVCLRMRAVLHDRRHDEGVVIDTSRSSSNSRSLTCLEAKLVLVGSSVDSQLFAKCLQQSKERFTPESQQAMDEAM